MNGVIISIPVPHRVCRRLASLDVPGKDDLPPYHVTIAYFGKMDDINDRTRKEMITTVYDVCRRHPPMAVKIGGFGVFAPSEGSDGKAVLHYEMDSPGLAELRTDLTRALDRILPVKNDHGFVPHVTVGYLPEGKRLSSVKVPDVEYPDWTAHSVEIMFGSVPVEISLGGEGLYRSLTGELRPLPVITLVKGRTKGSKNKVRRYLARLELPGKDKDGNPRYEYIYPDPDEVESFHPKLGYTLKPKRGEDKPRTISQIINDHLFGSYGIHRVRDKSGKEVNEPWHKDGFFIAYEPQRSTDHLKRKYGTPIDTDTIGRVRFYKYRKMLGFTSIDLGPGVERKYTIPQKVLNLQLTTPEDIAHAEAHSPGAGIKEGPVPAAEHPNYVTDTGPVGEINIHAVPEPTEQTENALSEPVTDSVDPLAYAQRAIARASKKKIPSVPNKVKVLPFPQEAIDTFGGEGELIDELQKRPATTLVTLGKYSPKQRAVQNQLDKEWRGVINGLARDAFRWTYRLTGRYKQREEQDQAAGFQGGGGPGLRSYRKQVTDDLIQQGRTELFALAKEYAGYPAGHKPGKFDAWVYNRLKGRINDYSKEQAQQYEGGVPEHLLEEHEIDEAARHQGYTVEMSPEEAAELREVRRKAKASLLKILHSKKLPEAYRRVFTSRHYLDSPESIGLEADTIDKRREAVGQKKELGYQPRPFTGSGSIAEVYPEWTDPKGKKIKFEGMNQSAQLYHLNKWYEEAQKKIFEKLSRPSKNEYGAEIDERVLNNAGRAVRDWLTLEAKLAAGNRRLYEDREGHEKILVPGKVYRETPEPATRQKLEPVINKPAVSFFADHPELAAKVGVKLDKLDMTSGLHQGTAAQQHLDLAERFHNTLLGLKEHSPQKLTAKITATERAVESLQKLHDHHLDKLHQAVADYQRHGQRLEALGEQLKSDKRTYAERRHVAELAAKNPIDRKADPICHAAFQHVSKIGRIKNIPDLEAGIRDYIVTNQKKWPDMVSGRVMNRFVEAIRKEFITTGAIKVGEDKSKVAEFKQRAEAIKEDKDFKAARQRVTRVANKVAEIKVGETPVGAHVVQSYVQALRSKTPITTEHAAPHKAAVHSALRHAEGELELLRFERDQRKVKKAMAAGDLFKVFSGLEGVLGVLWKNDALPADAHHVAYTRRSKTGKIEQVKSKGWQPVATQPKAKVGGRPTGGAGAQLPQELKDRLQKLGVGKLPAAHISDIRVHERVHDDDQAHSGALLTWKDDAGHSQTSYSSEFDRRNAEKKWDRILKNRPKVEQQMDLLRSKVLESPAHAAAMLIALTGLRPGSSMSEKKTGHFGATTMQVRHLTFEGEGKGATAHVSYIGKNGKLNQATVDDPTLVKALQALTQGKQPEDRIFTAPLKKIKATLPKGVKIKDLRTILATVSAENLLKGYKPTLSTPTGDEKKDAANKKADARNIVGILKAVSTAVSKQLNNTPAMARKSYIAPQVIRAWGESHGIDQEWLA